MSDKMKRVVVISDLHCGHRVGLTPEPWQIRPNPENHVQQKISEIQSEVWNFYKATILSLKPIDVLIVNGDAIDGKGIKTGGTEQIDENRITQVDMASYAIKLTEATNIFMTYGTGYHTGQEEDWEELIARDVDAKIGSHEWIDVNGLMFDVKHHVGSSSIPHGRHTAVSREALWNLIWSESDEQPKSDIIIRSHVHYHAFSGQRNKLAMTTPALQGYGSKYGSRRCSGTVDVGLVYFDVCGKDDYSWKAVTGKMASMKAKAVKV